MFAALDPLQARVLKGKNLAVFKQVLLDINYPDVALVDDLLIGTKLTGEVGASGVFPRRQKVAATTAGSVLGTSALARLGVIARIASSGDSEVDLSVWQETLAEETKG